MIKTLKKLTPAALLTVLAAPVMAMVIIYGYCYGDWELPTSTSNGYAVGLLDDTGGTTIFKMKAELTATPAPLGTENGNMAGVLDLASSTTPWPMYFVKGTYTGSSLTHEGTFKGYIYKQVSPFGPTTLIGKMAGKYSDPGSPNPIGAFKGEWKADV